MNKDLENVIQKIDKLPNVFSIAVRISQMLNDPEINAQEIANTISLDQALCAQVLKACNSAHYGFSRKITSIQDAIVKLGFKTLKSLVYMVLSHSQLSQDVEGYCLVEGALWRNSLACGVYSRYLAKKVNYVDPEVAFTAGLLRDIGKLAIHEHVGINYDKIITKVNTDNISFLEAEREIIGFDHCEIGAAMGAKWNFPIVLSDVIKYHHAVDAAKSSKCKDLKLVAIVHVADSITMMLGDGLGSDGMMYDFQLQAFEILKITKQLSDIEGLISEMIELNSEIEMMQGSINEK